MSDFADLYRRYAPDVFRFALYLTGNRNDAEDITAETFARVWASPQTIRTQTVKGYLCTIARNLFLADLRKRSRRGEMPVDVPDRMPGPLERVEKKDALENVMRGLQKLREVDRAALVMRAVEELSYEEISAALGITLSAVKVKIHRARLALSEDKQWK